MVQFKNREIFLIFAMLVVVMSVVFGLGVFLGHEFQRVSIRKIPQEPVRVVEKADKPLLKENTSQPVEAGNVASSENKSAVVESELFTGFTIQVGAMVDKNTAEAEYARIQSLGFPSLFLREATLADRKFFFIDLGYFKEKEQAEKLARRLLAKGVIDSYLIRQTDSGHDQENR